jgi:hypothetical protein
MASSLSKIPLQKYLSAWNVPVFDCPEGATKNRAQLLGPGD